MKNTSTTKFCIERKSLTECLGILPVGFWLDGVQIRKFQLRSYTTENDFSLLKYYQRSPYNEDDHNLTDFAEMICGLLPQIVESVEGYTLPEIARKMNLSTYQLVREMAIADIFTVLLNIRVANGGLDVAFGDICPECNTKNEDDPRKGIYHSLEGIEIGFIRHQHLVVETVSLGKCYLEPLKLKDFGQSVDNIETFQSCFRLVSKIEDALVDFDEEHWQRIQHVSDRNALLKAFKLIMQVGPEREVSVQMRCKSCRNEWDSLLGWEAMNLFYQDLLKPPPESYLHDLISFLTIGEQAPCKSINEAIQIPVKIRDAMVKKLSEVYENQKKEMDKSSGKSKTTKQTY